MKTQDNTIEVPSDYPYLYLLHKDKPQYGLYHKDHGEYTNQQFHLYGTRELHTYNDLKMVRASKAQFHINVTIDKDVYGARRFKDMVRGQWLDGNQCRLNAEYPKSLWPKSTSPIYTCHPDKKEQPALW